jgi:hypothetical protein
MPDFWPAVLKAWLGGQNADQIAASLKSQPGIPPRYQKAMAISGLIDDLCDYRLPWGLNAISTFWAGETADEIDPDSERASEEPAFIVPPVVSYFASMLRFGVHCPVAAVLIASGLSNRVAALTLSSHYDGAIEPNAIAHWLGVLAPDDLERWITDTESLNLVLDFLERIRPEQERAQSRAPQSFGLVISIESSPAAQALAPGMRLLYRIEDNSLCIFSPAVDFLTCVDLSCIQGETDALRGEAVSIVLQEMRGVQDRIELELTIA